MVQAELQRRLARKGAVSLLPLTFYAQCLPV